MCSETSAPLALFEIHLPRLLTETSCVPSREGRRSGPVVAGGRIVSEAGRGRARSTCLAAMPLSMPAVSSCVEA